MANTFFRLPKENGDENTWAQYVLALEKNAIGDYTSYLYDDSGVLKLSLGRVGINNGTTSGIVLNDTITTISIAGVSNSNWAAIEMSVAGITATYTATDIAGETEEYSIPSDFTGNWDYDKNGIYITSTKRTIGVIYKNSGGTLSTIINGNYLSQNNANRNIQSTVGVFSPGLLRKTHLYQSASISTTFVSGTTLTDQVKDYIPNDGDYIDVSGTIQKAASGGTVLTNINVVRMERISTTPLNITFYGVVDRVINGGVSSHDIIASSLAIGATATAEFKCVLCW